LKAKSLMLVVVLPAALTLAGCDQVKKLVGGKPKGQVVATVGGEEITSIELGRELGNFSSKDPKIMKAAQQQALQQIIMRDLLTQPNGKIKPDQLKALKTLEDVKALFDAQAIPHRENVATIDTLNTDPRMIDQIDKLPAGEVFIVPQQGALMFNRIASSKSLPIQGDMAVNYALGVLRNQKAQALVRTQMIALRSGAEKSITYNPAYKPDKPFTPPPAPGAAPTPAASGVPAASAAAAPAAAKAPGAK
jgi:hypothetical protein